MCMASNESAGCIIMWKISNDDLMGYADGTLDAGALVRVENHLRTHPDDAAMVADMKAAMAALHDWNDAEPVRVSPDFWPKVRSGLDSAPKRGWWRGAASQAAAWLWPRHSRLGISVRIAAIAGILALAGSWFAPHQQIDRVDADQQFITQSLDRHAAYVSSQPLSSAAPVGDAPPLGDAKSAQHSDDDLESAGQNP